MNQQLTAYYDAKSEFEHDYPFKTPVKTGLESLIFKRISTAAAWKNVNDYALTRIMNGNREGGEVYLVVVRVAATSRSDDGRDSIMHCIALDPGRPTRGLPVTLYRRGQTSGLRELSAYVVIARAEGAVIAGGNTQAAKLTEMGTRRSMAKIAEKHPNPLTLIDFKYLKG
jgi:hypothetical protein